jgi:branched-chain amino acid transport system permease protein
MKRTRDTSLKWALTMWTGARTKIIIALLLAVALISWPGLVGKNPSVLPQILVNGLYQGSVYTLIALGLTMVFGMWHIPNFAHGNIFMLGAYLVHFFVTRLGVSCEPGSSSGGYFFVSMLLSVIICAVVSAASDPFLFRPLRQASPKNAFIVTIGLFIIIESVVSLIWDPSKSYPTAPPWDGQLTVADFSVSYQKVLVLVATPILILLLLLLAKYTKMGTAMRAAAHDTEAAALMGINVNRISLITFALAGGLAAAAGALIASYPGTHLFPQMSHRYTFVAFVVIVLGGLGSTLGAIVGGYLIGLAESIGAGYTNGWLPVIGTGYAEYYGLIVLLLIMMLKPTGLFGRAQTEGDTPLC